MTPDAINTVIDFDHPDIQNTILVNADEDLAFCDAFRVRGTPAILFVKDGEVVRHETGSPSPEQLLSIVEEYK